MVAKKTAASKARARLDANNLEVTATEDAPGALGGGGISSDHPLAIAFERSYDAGHEVSVTVNDTALAQKLLQKLATKTGRGLRKSVSGKVVTFLVSDKKPRVPRNKTDGAVETAVDKEL